MESEWFVLVLLGLVGVVVWLLAQAWRYHWPSILGSARTRLDHSLERIDANPSDDSPARKLRAEKSYRWSIRRWNIFRVVTYAFTILFGLWIVFGFRNYTPQATYADSDAFTSGWNEGWNASCDNIFAYSPRYEFYYGDTKYTADWCKGLNQEEFLFSFFGEIVPAYIPNGSTDDYFDAGANNAYTVALQTVFSVVPQLCYGNECIDLYTILDDNMPTLDESFGF
jgi:hypothetical protein